MGARRERLDSRKAKATKTRRRNSPLKTRERQRREDRMLKLLKTSKPPYAPAVESWLSRKLDKPAAKITPKEIKALLA